MFIDLEKPSTESLGFQILMNNWKTFDSIVSYRHIINLFSAFYLIAMRGPKEGPNGGPKGGPR